MKRTMLRRVILSSLPIAYLIAVVFTVLECKPANFVELLGAILAASYLSLHLFPIVWYALAVTSLLLALPVLAVIYFCKIFAARTDTAEPPPENKRKKTNTDASSTGDHPRSESKAKAREQLTTTGDPPRRTKRPNLPAVPEVPKLPKIK